MKVILGKNLMKLSEENQSDFKKQKASGALLSKIPATDEKDESHQLMMEVKTLLEASGYRTWKNIMLSRGEYPCYHLAQTLSCPTRKNLVIVWDTENLFSNVLPDTKKPSYSVGH